MVGSTNGRFVMMSPPNDYYNFAWVLDTQTGAVAAYRFVSSKNEKGEIDYWAFQRLIFPADLRSLYQPVFQTKFSKNHSY